MNHFLIACIYTMVFLTQFEFILFGYNLSFHGIYKILIVEFQIFSL